MNAPTNVQIIKGADGAPAYVVIPYEEYIATHPREDLVPHEVVGLMVNEGISPAAAWRKHLGLTQTEVAARIGISQAAYAQQELVNKPRKKTLASIAAAMEISTEQLDLY